jgi:4-carboxymuconolactone decarboxylase
MSKTEKYEKGMQVRRSVLGDAHVDRAEASKIALDDGFQELITEAAWGSVWAGDHFTKRERSLITLALLAGQGNSDEIALHVRAAQNTGTSAEDIMEAMLHVAIYCGVPKVNYAIKVVKQTLSDLKAGV